MSTPLDKHGYVMSESDGQSRRYRLILGFASLSDLQDAHEYVVKHCNCQSPTTAGYSAKETAVDQGAWLIRKRGYYYRPNRAGYTSSIDDAGRYTEAEAKAEAAIEPAIIQAIPLSHAMDEIYDPPALNR